MKIFLLASMMTISPSVFACEQAPAAVYDLADINDALKSSAFEDEMQKQYERSFDAKVTKIDFSGANVRVRLTNNCDILVTVTRWSDNGGMCPQLDKVTATTKCR